MQQPFQAHSSSMQSGLTCAHILVTSFWGTTKHHVFISQNPSVFVPSFSGTYRWPVPVLSLAVVDIPPTVELGAAGPK